MRCLYVITATPGIRMAVKKLPLKIYEGSGDLSPLYERFRRRRYRSGGEAILQAEFVRDWFRACKKKAFIPVWTPTVLFVVTIRY